MPAKTVGKLQLHLLRIMKMDDGKWYYEYYNMTLYEPCCKLSCIVSWFEVTFKKGFEDFSWKTMGDALKIIPLRHTCRYCRTWKKIGDALIYPKHTAFTTNIHRASYNTWLYISSILINIFFEWHFTDFPLGMSELWCLVFLCEVFCLSSRRSIPCLQLYS